MMKIPLRFSNNGYLYLKCFIRMPDVRVSGWIDFVVDTGSNVTFVNEDDLVRLNIPFDRLDRPEGQRLHTGLGGGTIEFREARKATLVCGNDKDGPVKFELGPLLVGKTTRKKEHERIAEPSIMGTDFLSDNNLALHFDPAGKDAYLEKHD